MLRFNGLPSRLKRVSFTKFNKWTATKKAAKGGKKGEESGEPKVSEKLDIREFKRHMFKIINSRLPDPKYKYQPKEYLNGLKPSIENLEDELKPLESWDRFDRLSASLVGKHKNRRWKVNVNT
jgi:hypothetical protein